MLCPDRSTHSTQNLMWSDSACIHSFNKQSWDVYFVVSKNDTNEIKKIIREQSCMSMTRAIEKHPVSVLTHAVYSTLMSNIMRNIVQSFTSSFTWPRCRRVVLVIVGLFDVTNDKIKSIYINYSWLLISWNASQNMNWTSVICTLIIENEINENDFFDCFKSEYTSYFKVWN